MKRRLPYYQTRSAKVEKNKDDQNAALLALQIMLGKTDFENRVKLAQTCQVLRNEAEILCRRDYDRAARKISDSNYAVAARAFNPKNWQFYRAFVNFRDSIQSDEEIMKDFLYQMIEIHKLEKKIHKQGFKIWIAAMCPSKCDCVVVPKCEEDKFAIWEPWETWDNRYDVTHICDTKACNKPSPDWFIKYKYTEIGDIDYGADTVEFWPLYKGSVITRGRLKIDRPLLHQGQPGRLSELYHLSNNFGLFYCDFEMRDDEGRAYTHTKFLETDLRLGSDDKIYQSKFISLDPVFYLIARELGLGS